MMGICDTLLLDLNVPLMLLLKSCGLNTRRTQNIPRRHQQCERCTPLNPQDCEKVSLLMQVVRQEGSEPFDL